MAMPSNGHKVADRGRVFPVFKLGNTIAEKRPVEINDRIVWAWVCTNGRYPSSVAAQLDDARNRWQATRKPIDPSAETPASLWERAQELAELSEREAFAEQVQSDSDLLRLLIDAVNAMSRTVRGLEAQPPLRSPEVDWQGYLTEALCLIMSAPAPDGELYQPLSYEEADLLLPEQRMLALYELGYMAPPAVPGGEKIDEGDGTEPDEGGIVQAPPEPGPSSTGDEPEPVSAVSIA